MGERGRRCWERIAKACWGCGERVGVAIKINTVKKISTPRMGFQTNC